MITPGHDVQKWKEGQMRMKKVMKGISRNFMRVCLFVEFFITFNRIIHDENKKMEQRYREQKRT